MTENTDIEIQKIELRLQQAMLQSDVDVLDELLATDLIFTNHLGQLLTKQDDIQAHKTGIVKIDKLSLSEQSIRVYDDFATVTVRANIIGVFNSVPSESELRFTRVWKKRDNNNWQIIVGHSSLIV